VSTTEGDKNTHDTRQQLAKRVFPYPMQQIEDCLARGDEGVVQVSEQELKVRVQPLALDRVVEEVQQVDLGEETAMLLDIGS
jgi:hypothetical protein